MVADRPPEGVAGALEVRRDFGMDLVAGDRLGADKLTHDSQVATVGPLVERVVNGIHRGRSFIERSKRERVKERDRRQTVTPTVNVTGRVFAWWACQTRRPDLPPSPSHMREKVLICTWRRHGPNLPLARLPCSIPPSDVVGANHRHRLTTATELRRKAVHAPSQWRVVLRHHDQRLAWRQGVGQMLPPPLNGSRLAGASTRLLACT